MSGFAEQIEAARVAHNAATAIEASARKQMADAFEQWDAGNLSAQSVRHRLEAIVRAAYRGTAAVAIQHTSQQSGLPNWKPKGVFTSNYLTSLIADIRRNLRDYKVSPKEEADRRRAILRMQLSGAVAAQRGYTDALIESYAELEALGYQLRKVWMANFVNNTPCAICTGLHGTSVGLREEFKVRPSDTSKVYINLQGPPRHPNCRCYLVILVVDLTNALDEIDVDQPEPGQTTMTTEQVKSIPKRIFDAIVKSLRLIKKVFKRGK
jgi:hypothetical protein